MAWELQSDRPIYTQILEHIEIRIVSGFYAPGSKLPSVRELAAEANVNPNTMQKALSALERSGLIQTQRTAGRSVTDDLDQIKATRGTLAQTQIRNFIKQMKNLGYAEEDISILLSNVLEGGTH